MGTWHYFQNGQQYGPASFDDLRRLAAGRQIGPQDQVWQEGTAEWIAAGTVPGLFARQAPAPPYAAPTAARKPAARKKVGPPWVLIIVAIAVAGAGITYLAALRYRASRTPAPAPVVKNDTPRVPVELDDLPTRLYKRGHERFLIETPLTPKEIEDGRQWLLQSMQLKNPDAALELGRLYADGKRVKKDDAEAFKCFTRAAKYGSAEGMSELASAYEHGTGVAADPIAARSWYAKAVAAGDPKAAAPLQALGGAPGK